MSMKKRTTVMFRTKKRTKSRKGMRLRQIMRMWSRLSYPQNRWLISLAEQISIKGIED